MPRAPHAAVIEAYINGPDDLTFKDLGNQFGITAPTVSKIIKRSGVPVKMSPNGRPKPTANCIECGLELDEDSRSWASVRHCEPCGKTIGRMIHRKKVYGISDDEYQERFTNQGGVCAICGNSQVRPLTIDHCHVTGAVRGLLCWNCNVGLGRLGDNLEGILRAAEYLRKSENGQRV